MTVALLGTGCPGGYQAAVISRKASRARPTSSASTSLWVTQRIEIGPIWRIFTLPPKRDGGVPDARAVQVHGDAVGVGHRGDRGNLLRSAAGAPVAVVSVLQAHEPRHGDVDIARPDVLAHLLGSEEPARRLQGQGL